MLNQGKQLAAAQEISSVVKTLKKILRRTVKSGIAKAKELMREDPPPPPPMPDFSNAPTAYDLLNWLLEASVREFGEQMRPYYTWGVLHAAHLARALGIPRISVLECGVAGGNGLLALEKAADFAERELGVGIDVVGFDTGEGLPAPTDYRDLPNIFIKSAYKMDVDALKKRLHRAQLILGSVEETMPQYLASNPAPLGFISIDVDLYSATTSVLKALEAKPGALLPRVHCYFDDVMAFTYSDFTGERLAIIEFNDSHPRRKISPIYGLKYFLPKPHCNHLWVDQMYQAHIFDHDLYCHDDGLVNHGATSFLALKTHSTQAVLVALAAMQFAIGNPFISWSAGLQPVRHFPQHRHAQTFQPLPRRNRSPRPIAANLI